MEDTNTDRPLAVVTGASSGIGYELAKQFAQNGYDLIIVSENPALVEAAQACRSFGAEVESVVIDLAEPNAVEALYDKISETGRPVSTLAINAGVIPFTGESALKLEMELNTITLNVTSPVQLARVISKDMLKRKQGKILFTSSAVESTPPGLQSVQRASRSFIQTFSENFRNELHGSGVTVTSVVPASHETHFTQTAAEVAEIGYQHMMAGEGVVEAGFDKIKTNKETNSSARAFGEPPKLKH